MRTPAFLLRNFTCVNSGRYHERTRFPQNWMQRKKMRIMAPVFVLLGFFFFFLVLVFCLFCVFVFLFLRTMDTSGGKYAIKYVYKLVVTFYFVFHEPGICVWKNFIVFSISFSCVTLCSTCTRQSICKAQLLLKCLSSERLSLMRCLQTGPLFECSCNCLVAFL